MTDNSRTRTVWPALINMALIAAIWLLTLSATAEAAALGEEWGAWGQLWAAYGWITGVSASASIHPWRRMQVLSSIGVALSIPVALQVAQAMPQPFIQWDVLLMARGVVTQGVTAWWLPLVGGLSLLVLSNALGIPHTLHRVSAISAWMLLWALAMRAGTWVLAQTPDAPWWLWLVGVLVLPPLRERAYHLVTFLWAVCACAFITWVTQELISLPTLQVDLLLFGLVLGLPTWIAWAWRMDLIQRMAKLAEWGQMVAQPSENDLDAPITAAGDDPAVFFSPEAFDLNQHLDSPTAQEGADKYTRE